MALVVEDGSSKSDADSYIAVADCVTYLNNYAPEGVNNPFTLLGTPEEQEIALRNATRFIDGNYALRFTGYKYRQDQSLQWPRQGATDNDRWVFDINEMPPVLLNATCELALQFVRDQAAARPATPPLMPTQTEPGVLTKKRVRADVVESEKEWDADAGGASQQPYYALADAILAPILESGTRVALG